MTDGGFVLDVAGVLALVGAGAVAGTLGGYTLAVILERRRRPRHRRGKDSDDA